MTGDDSIDINLSHSRRIHVPTGGIGSFNISISLDILKEILSHAYSDLNTECGGLLLGNMQLNKVQGSIPAKYADQKRASITFTQKTWEYFFQEKDRKFPDMSVVGWYHTHPGFGVFLSSFDIFIHKNFFNFPTSLALVIDPRDHTASFFEWLDDNIVKSSGFTISEIHNEDEYLMLRDLIDCNKCSDPLPQIQFSQMETGFIQLREEIDNILLIIRSMMPARYDVNEIRRNLEKEIDKLNLIIKQVRRKDGI